MSRPSASSHPTRRGFPSFPHAPAGSLTPDAARCSVISSAKEAKAAGLAWIDFTFRLPDGSRHEIKGPFSGKRALEIFLLVTTTPDDLAPAAKEAS